MYCPIHFTTYYPFFIFFIFYFLFCTEICLGLEDIFTMDGVCLFLFFSLALSFPLWFILLFSWFIHFPRFMVFIVSGLIFLSDYLHRVVLFFIGVKELAIQI